MSDISLSKAVRSNLLSLQSTATMMSKTQERLATGNKVNSALDNPTNFFTASSLNSRAADMGNLLDSMASGIKVIEAANNGLTALTKNLESMQSTLRQARQDKSFQTKSFDITADSVINLSGGQFGNSVSEISLASATIDGTKAEVGTIGADAYLGPVSVDGAATGAGARSVIDLGGGFTAADKFTVAGEEVTVTADITAQGIADAITAALDGGADTAGKYTVSVGTGDVAGKVVIETIDTSAAAASVNFDPDSDPATGIGSATKGTTTFNYSAITSSIVAGGQNVATGSNFSQFVTNLQNGATAGGYSVNANADTGEITLTSAAWAGTAPAVTGVATTSNAIAGSKAETSFQLANAASALTHDQDLTITGATGPITLTAGMDKDDVLDTLKGDANLNAAYDITVDNSFNVKLTEKTIGGATAPSVTSSQVAAPAGPSSLNGVGGLNFNSGTPANDNTQLQTLNGTTITLTSGGDTETYAITGASTVAALTAALTDSGFTVEATTTGLNFSRADGAVFEIEVDGGSGNGLGLGATTVEVDNGTVAATNGITGGTAATLVGAGGTDLTLDANIQLLAGTDISLDDGEGNTSTFSITGATTRTQLENALSQNGFAVTATNAGLNISRADGTNFSMSVSTADAADLGFPDPTITSTNGLPPAVTELDGQANVAAVNGKVTVNGTAGASVDTVAAKVDKFTVSYDGKTADISIAGVKGGTGPDAIEANALDINRWQSATITSVNDQLEAKGITGVEAKFDADGKFSLVAKTAEAETLAVSGRDAVALFGTDGIKTGVAEKSELNATKTVDKFVELINRDHGTQVRASNDNGKLRIENLSTQALDVGVDTNGNDVINSMSIGGNSNRENLSKQFNEARDQLDKLSDDASFNGINLLRGDKLTITFNENGSSSIDIQAKDKSDMARSINASSLGIDSIDAVDLDNDAGIDAFLSKITTALSDIRSQASSFGSKLSSVENRQTFTKSMINTLQTGAANLTLADMNEEAANLLALQTRQSLSSSTLSMASQADQSVLQLLR